MKENLQYVILGLAVCIFTVYGFYYGIDRTMAMEDYKAGKEAEHCIFQSNCDYYNNMLRKVSQSDNR